MSYVYIKSEPRLWTVGFFDPTGKFQPESDHDNKRQAGDRVAYLNGNGHVSTAALQKQIDELFRIALPMRLIGPKVHTTTEPDIDELAKRINQALKPKVRAKKGK